MSLLGLPFVAFSSVQSFIRSFICFAYHSWCVTHAPSPPLPIPLPFSPSPSFLSFPFPLSFPCPFPFPCPFLQPTPGFDPGGLVNGVLGSLEQAAVVQPPVPHTAHDAVVVLEGCAVVHVVSLASDDQTIPLQSMHRGGDLTTEGRTHTQKERKREREKERKRE